MRFLIIAPVRAEHTKGVEISCLWGLSCVTIQSLNFEQQKHEMSDLNSDDPWRDLEYSFGRRLFYYWMMTWGSVMTVLSSVGFVLTQTIFRKKDLFTWWSRFWSRSMFAGTGIRVEYVRRVELDCRSSYVFASNHQVLVDIPILSVAIPCSFGFVAKSELGRVPFLGQAIQHSPSVFVDSSNARKSYESIKIAGKRIRAGTSVIIYPEGERTYRRDLLPFQRGAFILALEAGVPIVPVTILDAYQIFNEQTKLARPGVVRVVVGRPINLEGLTRADIPEVMTNVRQEIERQFNFDNEIPMETNVLDESIRR